MLPSFKFNKLVSIVLIATSTMIIGACASTPSSNEIDKQVKDTVTKQVPTVPKSRQYSDKSIATKAAINIDWLKSFNDPLLEKLVAEARLNNKDLQAAAANVEHALALAEQAGAALKPSVNLSAGRAGSGNFDSDTSNTISQNIGLQFNWELDIWGRIRSGQQAEAANAQAAAAEYRYTQHSLAAATVKAYLTAIEAGLQTNVTKETLSALEDTLRIVKVRHENGLSSAQDLALTRSDLANAREALINIQGSQRNALRALEVLLGRYPSADLKIKQQLPASPSLPPNGIPADLLERRPDIIAAERRVASSFNATAQAKVASLPSVSLTGSLGGASNSLSSLLDPTNIAWQLASNLLAPLFDGGARKAKVKASSAKQKQAIAAYAQAALEAFKEVETELDQGMVLAQRETELQQAKRQAKEAYRIAKLRYKEGETDLLDVLTIQKRVNNASSNASSIQRLMLEQRVNLHLALGGDW